MPSKLDNVKMALGLLLLFAGPAQAAELLTLFTTPQERQIINSNRYKNDDGVSMRPVETDAAPQPVQLLVREEVTREYRVSGITVSSDGPHTVWINSLAYEDGEQLEDRSRVKVIAGDEVKVRITAPDGKQYFAVSGETLEITYLAAVEN
jgi:hypothetical protein